MSPITKCRTTDVAGEATIGPRKAQPFLDRLKRYYQARDETRRGICMLNAGQYDLALQCFRRSDQIEPRSRSLPALMAACYDRKGDSAAAVSALEPESREQDDITNAIRKALLLWKGGRTSDAVASLRHTVTVHPESAELHFQLGTLLAAEGDLTEAELRFGQAVSVDKTHFEGLVSLAQCCAVRGRVADAVRYLERAQRRRPGDTRVNLLVTQAVKSLADQGTPVSVQAVMPAETPLAEDDRDIERLAYVIEREPEFVDAFLGLPSEDLNADVYATLAETIHRAIDRHPADARLLCAQGGIYRRLGQPKNAIEVTEKAIDADPRYVRALIQLGELYMETDRCTDAVLRFEQALDNGIRYADVYYLLGNLYRRNGNIAGARQAYRQALNINKRYEAARKALDSLAA